MSSSAVREKRDHFSFSRHSFCLTGCTIRVYGLHMKTTQPVLTIPCCLESDNWDKGDDGHCAKCVFEADVAYFDAVIGDEGGDTLYRAITEAGPRLIEDLWRLDAVRESQHMRRGR